MDNPATVIGVVTGLGGAVLGIIGTLVTRRTDELSAFRKELREENTALELRIEKLEQELKRQGEELIQVKFQFAAYRERVRHFVTKVKHNDDDWMDLANRLEADEHEVDELLRQRRGNGAKQ